MRGSFVGIGVLGWRFGKKLLDWTGLDWTDDLMF